MIPKQLLLSLVNLGYAFPGRRLGVNHLYLTYLKEIDFKKDWSEVDLQCCVSFRCAAQWCRAEKHRLLWWPSGKESPAVQEIQETWVQSLGQEDPLEESMAIHFDILAWRIPRAEESGRLQSIGSQRVGDNWSDLASTHTHTHTYINTHTHTYIYSFQILFHYSLLCSVEYSSLHYTVGSCCLSVLYIIVCIC